MDLILITSCIFLLYWRCLDSYYMIDDIVRRWGFLYEVPETSPHPSFFSTKPTKWRHFFPIIVHSINVWIVYITFGWVPAILLAFSPLSVVGTAWITGSYYAVTTLFTLTTYYFLVHYPDAGGALLACLFFAASLGSTITCIGVPFIFLVFPGWGLALFFPMAMYLLGRRFTKGFQIRDMGKQDSFNIKTKIPVMTKTMAYYIHLVVFPYRLSFFRRFGEDYVKDKEIRADLESFNKWFWISLLTVFLFLFIGWQFSPVGTVWFLATMAPFSQFKVLGQFVAERYVYLPAIGWYLILGSALAPIPWLLAVVVVLYALRTHFYIPAYHNMESLYLDGIRNDSKCLANYANLGERYIHIGEMLKGYQTLQRGLAIDPDNFLCYTNTAAYWIQVKDLQRGLYYTEKAIEYGRVKSSWHITKAMEEQLAHLKDFERKYLGDMYKKEHMSHGVAVG